MLIPASEYRDLFYVWFMGPWDVGDFAQYNISSDSVAGSSISSISDSSSLSAPATSGPISSFNVVSSGEAGGFCPDKDTYLDAAWIRAENISTVDVAKFRLLSVAPGQRVIAAAANNQWLTENVNVGDESSSESLTSVNQDTTKFEPAVNRTKINLTVRDDRGGIGDIRPAGTLQRVGGQNLIRAGGLLLATFESAPTNLAGLRVGLRLRERRM